MKKSNQQGFGFVFVLLAIVVVGAVAFAAVRVMGNSSTDSAVSLAAKTQVPAKISTKVELKQASKALDETPVDRGVNPDQLDNDLNSLL